MNGPTRAAGRLPPFAETDDAIGLAGDTGVVDARRAVRTSGTIGDGPHGSAGDGTDDVDFYRLGGGASGVTFTARTSTPTGDLDTFLALFDADGAVWAVDSNVGGTTDSAIMLTIPPGRDLYLMVGSAPFGVPRDPKPLPAAPCTPSSWTSTAPG
ncbi:hypothetical protein FHS29_003840 [Saccharothrix tamanrassetensis]|uniref:Uncharacterized protein n=1 Tax=Saccharothrix tamanrassetensis TaxID=1051531 RepID=A0A841CMD1_9PSEU|nr:hypothetical protein [Saccharothrix tamanrassetensis]MBB5957247.1 hypothetical protein [Saccharothrix tamanrassetensis]